MLALSVSTSAIESPAPKASPSATCQRAMVPVSIVGESAGTLTTLCGGSERRRLATGVALRSAPRAPRRSRAPSILPRLLERFYGADVVFAGRAAWPRSE